MSNIFEIMLKGIDILSVSVVEEPYEIKECIKNTQKNLTEWLRRSQEEQFEANKLAIEIDSNKIWKLIMTLLSTNKKEVGMIILNARDG
jgi:hypothetical protein